MIRTLSFAAALAVVLASTIPARASPQTDGSPQTMYRMPRFVQPDLSISYAKADLRDPDGATRLLHRIDAAAVTACGGARPSKVDAARLAFDACRRETVRDAVARVGSPILSALNSPQDASPTELARRRFPLTAGRGDIAGLPNTFGN